MHRDKFTFCHNNIGFCFSHTLLRITLLMDAQQSTQNLKAHKNAGRQDSDMNQAP
jgi:hypothetical protein